MRLAGTLGLWIVVGAALAAADFWNEKDFTTWSDKEVEKMLSDSPWSRRVTIAIRGQGARGSGDLFGGAGGGGGRGGGRDSFDVGCEVESDASDGHVAQRPPRQAGNGEAQGWP